MVGGAGADLSKSSMKVLQPGADKKSNPEGRARRAGPSKSSATLSGSMEETFFLMYTKILERSCESDLLLTRFLAKLQT